jgi:hypothetical protein
MQMERSDVQQKNASTPICFKCDIGRNVTSESSTQCLKHNSSITSIGEGIENEVILRSTMSLGMMDGAVVLLATQEDDLSI